MSEAAVYLSGVGKRYGAPDEPWAVRSVTLSIHPGELTVLMGPSGSGKTTLLSLIGGLLSPNEGRLNVCGHALEGLSEQKLQVFRRRCVGFVFQSCNLLSSLTAEENLRVALALRGADEGKARKWLERVGLGEKAEAFPMELSGGQRQRVAIARALAGRPPVLLADEPTAALDAFQGRRVMDLLRRCAKEEGTGVLVVTHDPRVREFADRVIEMEDGRVRRVVRRVRREVPVSLSRRRDHEGQKRGLHYVAP